MLSKENRRSLYETTNRSTNQNNGNGNALSKITTQQKNLTSGSEIARPEQARDLVSAVK